MGVAKPPECVIKQRGEIWEQWIHLSKRGEVSGRHEVLKRKGAGGKRN